MLSAQRDLWQATGGPRICVVQTHGRLGNHRNKNLDRVSAADSFGARLIRSEIPWQYDIVSMDRIANYDFALLSITSVVEMESVLKCSRGISKGSCVVIAGGMGMLNVWPMYDLIDVAVFGRAEGQIARVLAGESFPNVWRKKADPSVRGDYMIRQADRLLPGEIAVGCHKRCSFCQYSAIRRQPFTANYSPGRGLHEDDWNSIELKAGRNISAWDGLSELTRRRVRKNITDAQITRKLTALRVAHHDRASNIKIYNIVGYPWETKHTYDSDMRAIADLLHDCDGRGGRILIMFCLTPFSPEPFTEMQSLNVAFENWHGIAGQWGPFGRERQVFNGEAIEAFVLPQIPGPLTLQKRIALNRCGESNRARVIKFVTTATEPLEDFYRVLDIETFEGYRFLSVPE